MTDRLTDRHAILGKVCILLFYPANGKRGRPLILAESERVFYLNIDLDEACLRKCNEGVK